MGAAPAFATSDPVFEARRAAEDLQSATRALTDAHSARDRVRALSRAVRAYERGLGAMRESLRRVAVRKAALEGEFAARREQIAALMGVLETQGRLQAPLLFLHPSGPLESARAGQILAEVMPAVRAQARDLRARLEELAQIAALRRSVRSDLETGLDGVREARLALSRAIGQRTPLPKRHTADPAHMKALLENSDTLAVFADGLGTLPPLTSGEETVRFSDRKGRVALPVFGSLLRAYREADAAGLRRPGILVAAPAVSMVVAPHAATIRYLGPLLDYGNVIILEPEAGYLIVLAGLGEVFGEVGQIVPEGEPIGLLRGRDPGAEDFLVEASAGNGAIRQETLYIEIRRGRKTVNPEDWFAVDQK